MRNNFAEKRYRACFAASNRRLGSARKTFLAVATLALLLAPLRAAQESFDVASIKPGDPSDRRMMINVAPGGRFRTVNAPVTLLIRAAYRVQDFQILGAPEWAKSERYDIEAKSGDDPAQNPEKMTPDERELFQKRFQSRLQALLADRFGLKLHREMKEMPVYDLIVAKNGPKLSPAAAQTDGKPQGMMRMGRGELTGTAVGIDALIHALSDQAGLTVIDKTGMKGEYNFKLEWAPEPGQLNSMAPPPGARPPGADSAPPADSTLPSLVTAIQEQLGLKLESTKGQVEVLVIDHVERPSPN